MKNAADPQSASISPAKGRIRGVSKNSAEARRKILDSATLIFGKQGFARTKTEEINLAISRKYWAAALERADRAPCFQTLRLPLGAPRLVPPCILHRRLPLTTGDWHSAPERV